VEYRFSHFDFLIGSKMKISGEAFQGSSANPHYEESYVAEQLDALSDKERLCVFTLTDKWNATYPANPIPLNLVLRYARNSPGEERFNAEAAWRTLIKLGKQPSIAGQMILTVSNLEHQLRKKTLFSVPGLKTKDGYDVLYMRPKRYAPSTTPINIILDNLAYCMNCMLEKETACRDGIVVLANMDDWTMKHYGSDYWMKVCHRFFDFIVCHKMDDVSISNIRLVHENATRTSNSCTCELFFDCESTRLV
jgi:CRAL/TRIO domain